MTGEKSEKKFPDKIFQISGEKSEVFQSRNGRNG